MPITRRAPAKINLTLEVLGRRPDGFHALRGVMQAISLHDTITAEPAEAGAFLLEGGSEDAPPDDSNLVLRAARALDAASGGGHGARLSLIKRIPVSAGLGGGSSDAAATLVLLNDLWGTQLSTPALHDVAAGLGSDVPFFLTGGTALIEGRGERITPLRSGPRLWLVIAKPAASLSTPDVYREFDRQPAQSRLSTVITDWMVEVATGEHSGSRTVADVAAVLHNDLQPSAIRLCPETGAAAERLRAAGALGTLVCGSGSAVFGLVNTCEEAQRIALQVQSEGIWTVAAHTVSLPWEGDA